MSPSWRKNHVRCRRQPKIQMAPLLWVPHKGHLEQLVTTEAFSTETRSAGRPWRVRVQRSSNVNLQKPLILPSGKWQNWPCQCQHMSTLNPPKFTRSKKSANSNRYRLDPTGLAHHAHPIIKKWWTTGCLIHPAGHIRIGGQDGQGIDVVGHWNFPFWALVEFGKRFIGKFSCWNAKMKIMISICWICFHHHIIQFFVKPTKKSNSTSRPPSLVSDQRSTHSATSPVKEQPRKFRSWQSNCWSIESTVEEVNHSWFTG